MTTTTAERPVLERALSAIEGRDGIADAIQELKRRRASLRRPGANQLVGDLFNEIRDAALAGEPLPDGLGARILADEQDIVARDREMVLLENVVHDLEHEFEQMVRTHNDQAIAFLNAEHDELLAEVRALDGVLGSVASVEAAVKDPAHAAAWSQLGACRRRYDELRAAQLHLLRKASGDDGGNVKGFGIRVDAFGWASNARDLNPSTQAALELAAEKQRSVPVDETEARALQKPPPWPRDPIAHLRWLATSDQVEPRLLNLRALNQVHDDLHATLLDLCAPSEKLQQARKRSERARRRATQERLDAQAFRRQEDEARGSLGRGSLVW